MADLSKIVQRYEVTADVSGLDKLAAAATKATTATKNLSTATSGLVTSTATADKSALGVSSQLDRMTKAADPAAKALSTLERYQRLLAAATKQGVPVTSEYTRTLETLKARHEEASKATNEHSAAMGLNRSQMFELGHVARSLADDFASGTLGIRSFAQEGGRIGQVLAEGNGGVSGTLKSIGGLVARAATGWIGFGVAAAAGIGLASAALIRFQSQQDRLALSLNGAGRFAGVSVGGLAGIANSAAGRNPYLGQGGATSLAASFASTGRISSALMPGLLDVTTPYARGTGQSISAAGEELGKAFSAPSKGADQLNEKLGFLDDKTKQLIASLERQGDLFGAQEVLLGKVSTAAGQMADRTWGIARAWDALTSAVGSGANKFGAAFSAPTTQDRLGSLYAEQERRRGAGSGFGMGFSSFNTSAPSQSQLLGLNYQLYGESRGASDTATRAASDKATNDLSISVGEAVRKALPEVDKTQELTDTLKLLDDAIRNPETAGKVRGGAGAIGLAAGRYSNLLANSDPLQRINQDSALSVQAAQAQTGAERTLVEARRAELEVLRSTGDATQAAAKSLEAWNTAIAKSNKEADDALRSAQQRAGLIGLSPLQRSLRENDYRYDELRRNSVTGPVSALDGAFTALDDRTTPLARAIALGSSGSSSFLDAAGTLSGSLGKRTNRVIPTSRAAPEFPDHFAVPLGSMAYDYGGGSPSSDVTVSGARRVGRYAPAASRLAPGNIILPSSSGGTLNAAQSVDTGAIMDQMTTDRIRQSSDELQRNQQLLDVRTKSIGSSTAAMTKAVHVQEDWNELQLTDNDKKLLGTQRVRDLGDSIDTLATKQTSYDKQQQAYQNVAGASNFFQSTGDSVVSGLGGELGDLFNANPRNLVGQLKVGDQAKYYAGQLSGGQVKSKVFQGQAGTFLRNLAFQQGIGMIQHGLFGQGSYGSPGYSSGVLGGLFNGLLGGGGGGGGLGALFGLGGGGGSAAGVSSLFSGGFGGFALGGIMTSRGAVPLRRYAGGGVANSPQVAMFGEGSGPEAYVPLPDGRSIPVAMKGGGGAPNISLGGHTIVIQGSADDKTAALMDQKLAAANKQMMADLQRNFGSMQAKWQQRIGS